MTATTPTPGDSTPRGPGRPARVDQAAILKLFADGLRTRVIAERCGCSLSWVRQVLAKAKRQEKREAVKAEVRRAIAAAEAAGTGAK